jgi:hypothetical protein
MQLGETLSPDDKRHYIKKSLVPGRLLHLFCNFTTPPKNKFLAVVATTPELVLFFVNSEINPWLQARPDLRDRQVTLRQRDHPFLAQDSHLNCTEAIRKIPVQEIEAQLMNDVTRIKDMLMEGEREAIRYAVQNCRTLTKKEIGWITDGLARS